MISNTVELKEEGVPMIILREDVIKVEEHEYSHTDEDWSEADIPPDTPALMTEIEDLVSRDVKRNRLALVRQTRKSKNLLRMVPTVQCLIPNGREITWSK